MAILFISCSQASSVTDLERYQLQGNVLCTTVRSEDGSSYTAWFGKNGMLDSLIQESLTDTLSSIYHYNKKGHLQELSIYRPDRHYEGYYLYQYNGDVLERYTLFGWDLQAIFEWRFDVENGRQTRCRFYNEGALVSTTEYSYGEKVKTERVFDIEGQPCGEITYRYRDAYRIESICSEDVDIHITYGNDLLPQTSLGGLVAPDGEIAAAKGERISYSYETDPNGNWISRIENYSSGATKTINRTIIYR